MLPFESGRDSARAFAPPTPRQQLIPDRGLGQTAPKAQISNIAHGIFQPQPVRAGDSFSNIQDALKNDRGSVQIQSANLQQQRFDSGSSPKLSVAQGIQRQAPRAQGSLPGLPVRDFSFDAQLTTADVNSSTDDDDDDYDYFKHCRHNEHGAGLSSRNPISQDSRTSSAATASMIRNWIKHFTPRELVSVNAACSIFSPGTNWPGNVNLRQSETSSQSSRHQRTAQQTLTSLVLTAEAERSSSTGHLKQVSNPGTLVAKAPNQTQAATLLSSSLQQPALRNTNSMPPPTISIDQLSKGLNSPSATKRPRVSRKQPEPSVVSPCTVEPDYTAPRPVVNVHVPSFCECGATVVGVWYNKKPYYCQWFRHNRYAALRKLLEQNRCKSKHVSDRGRASELFTTLNIGSSDISRASSGDISSRASSGELPRVPSSDVVSSSDSRFSSGELPRVPSSDVVSSSDSRFSSGEFGPSEQPTFGVGMLEPDSKRVLVAADTVESTTHDATSPGSRGPLASEVKMVDFKLEANGTSSFERSCPVDFLSVDHGKQAFPSDDNAKSHIPRQDTVEEARLHAVERELAGRAEVSASDSADDTHDDDANATPKVHKKRASAVGTDIASPFSQPFSPTESKVPKSAEESVESEYSAPKFMSLVCVMQMVKLMDAVGILFPQTLPEGTKPITSKREFLDQFSSAKMSAHIDCPNCKAFVSYRWYANDVKELKTHLSVSAQDNKQVVGCCSLGHWKRKPPGAKPGRGDAKSSPQFLVNSRVVMDEVHSPFESAGQHMQCSPKAAYQRTAHDRRSGIADDPMLVDWETLDQGVWNVVRALKLLPPEVLEASLSIPFTQQLPPQTSHGINCTSLCDPHLNCILLKAGIAQETSAAARDLSLDSNEHSRHLMADATDPKTVCLLDAGSTDKPAAACLATDITDQQPTS